MMLERPLVHSPAESDEYFMQEGCFILEGWNRPEDPALSIARARVEPGERTRLHRLAGVVERYLILAGGGVLEVEGLAPRRVGSGDLVYIPAGAAQRIENDGDSDLIFLALCTPRFTPEVYQDIEPD
ncbi:MAG: cupin domain-containing protein [Chromatiales bacterium]|nr:cupin domain-containing protein [Chromatiales bacterium]